MAEIAPFRALRYNPRLVPDLAPVVTPPYDVISPAAQAEYYARHPNNMVRLILARADAEETPGQDRYQAAARTYAAWREAGVLCRDAQPAVYPYEQAFPIDGRVVRRRGLVALLKLADYEQAVVFPHERTFPRHKNDRLQLMRACPAHLESILAFYPGPAAPLAALLERCLQTAPLAAVTDADGVTHRLWSLIDAAAIRAARRALQDEPVIIADGHHRYETALAFVKERAAAGRFESARAPELFVLVNLVCAADPGLLILPTHRLLRGEPPADLDLRLGRAFQAERFRVENAAGLRAALATGRPRAGVSFLVYEGAGRVLRLVGQGGEAKEAEDQAEGSPGWPDAAILHRRVLEGLLGVAADADRIAYTHSEAEAMETVDGGRASLAFLLHPPSVGQVQAVALAGGRMPQKSTYFYPKVLSGLFIHPIEPGESVPLV
jgi:uncharacterized protein (DUF1015 family)